MSRFLSDSEKTLQANLMWYKQVVEGKSTKQIGQEMGLSHDTVERRLKHARAANTFIEFEQKIYDELIPLAHEALKMALEDGDAQVALAIYKGKMLLNEKQNSKSAEKDGEDLYAEIARRRAEHAFEFQQRTVAELESAADAEFVEGSDHVASGIEGHPQTEKVESPGSREDDAHGSKTDSTELNQVATTNLPDMKQQPELPGLLQD